MLISLFPRVTGLKLENSWGRGSSGAVRCTARLSRALRREEYGLIDRLPKTQVNRDEVVYECRPEEVESWHNQLVEALAGSSWERRAAVGGKRPARQPRRGRRPEPAA